MSSEILDSDLTKPRTVRPLTDREAPEELQRVETWLQARPRALASTYPQVFHPLGDGEGTGLFVQGRMVSHAVTMRVLVVTPMGPAKVTMVGSVATDPGARKAGMASDLIKDIVRSAAEQEQDAVLLWSDNWSFYQRLGFEGTGQQFEVRLRSSRDAFAPGIRPAQVGDIPALLRLHAEKPHGAQRDLHRMALLLSATPMTTMVLEREGEIVAYACFGKGLDFVGWWHEFGGSDEDVLSLVQGSMAVLRQEETMLMVPPYRKALLSLADKSIVSTTEGVSSLCLALTDRGRAEIFVDGLDSI